MGRGECSHHCATLAAASTLYPVLTLSFSTGINFTLDPSSKFKRELVFSRDLSVAKLTSPVIANVTGDVVLSSGCHYWKIRIDQFAGSANNGFVAVGVAKELQEGTPIGKMTY